MTFSKVMKFGGPALADGPAVERACRIIREKGGERPLVVVSAHQGVTAMLDTVAREAAEGRIDAERIRIRHRSLLRQLDLDPELLDRYFAELASLLAEIARRSRLLLGERDVVLSHGERMSARVVAHALKRMGVPATPVDAFDLGLTTDSNHGSARPLPESGGTVRAALLEVPGVPVVTGFLAKDRLGNLTTLGRNGSDLTASLLAEAVGAETLELWKSVGGMMSADPRIVPEARVIERLSFEEAAELAVHGAEILHPDALHPARRAGIAVRFLHVDDPDAPGTLLDADGSARGPIGIAVRRRLLRIVSSSRESAALGEILARRGVRPVLSVGNGDRTDLFVVPGRETDGLMAEIGPARIEKDLALVALVGRTDDGSAGWIARALEALSGAGAPALEAFVGPGRTSQVFLVGAADVERAVGALHAALLAPQGARFP